MSIVTILIGLAIVGFLCWLIQAMPLAAEFKRIAIGIIIFFMILYVIAFVAALLGHPIPMLNRLVL